MRLLRRLWAWALGLFTGEVKPPPVKVSEPFDHKDLMATYWPQQTTRRRSANICMASHGATKREKHFARRWT